MSDRIIEQLKAQKAFYKYDYGNANLDPWLTSELARLIASTGVTDIRNIASYKSLVPFVNDEGYTVYMNVQYYYDALTGKPIDKIGGRDYDPTKAEDIFAETHNNDFDFTYHIRFPGPYFVVTVKPREKSGSIFESLAPIMPVVMLAANIFMPGFASILGNAILGPIGVSSQVLATALGNVAISTVASGGDVEGAVKGAMLGSLGAGIGSAVGGTLGNVFDSDLIAKATSAATSAAITGGDLKTAVAGSLLPAGVQAMSDTWDFLSTPSSDFAMEPITMGNTDYSLSDSSDPFAASGTGESDFSVSSVGDYSFSTPPTVYSGVEDISAGVGSIASDLYNVDFSVPDVPIYTDTPNVTVAGGGADQTGTNWANTLSNLALTAIKLTQAYNAAGKPQVQISGQTSRGTVVAQPNGTVLVNGKVTMPPKGVPYLTPDGVMIMNNGDGTFTKISSGGISSTNPYAKNIVTNSAGNKTLMYAALGIGALFLLTSRR